MAQSTLPVSTEMSGLEHCSLSGLWEMSIFLSNLVIHAQSCVVDNYCSGLVEKYPSQPHVFEPLIPSFFERQGLVERNELLEERFLSFLALSISAFRSTEM